MGEMSKEWMPENPHRCFCAKIFVYSSAAQMEDIAHHKFDKGCQQTAHKLIGLLKNLGFKSYDGNVGGTWSIPQEIWESLLREVGLEEK